MHFDKNRLSQVRLLPLLIILSASAALVQIGHTDQAAAAAQQSASRVVPPSLSGLLETHVIRPGDAQDHDHSAWSLAVDGDTLLVGAPDEDGGVGDPMTRAGAVYVFQRDAGGSGNWGQVALLTAGDPAAWDAFGYDVDISGDTVVVGSDGKAYVFDRNMGGPDAWGAVAELEGSDSVATDGYGQSVGISGSTVVVGASREDGGPGDPLASSGAVYLYERDEGGVDNWGEVTILRASDPAAGDYLGVDVAISKDVVIAGADLKSAGAGAAYLFGRDVGGADSWGQAAKLTASDASNQDYFGNRVAIYGSTVVVSASSEDGGPGDPLQDSGAVYVYEQDLGGVDSWGEVVKLTASDSSIGDDFGRAVAVTDSFIVVGAPSEAGGPGDPINVSGAIYVFGRNSGGSEAWGQIGRHNAWDGQEFDQFGASLAVAEGGLVAAGTYFEAGGLGDPIPGSGATYLLEFAANALYLPVVERP
jgi:hypothetical protein